MIVKQDHTTSSAANACGNCGVEERRLIHHVRHRGIFRRLCTTCVLRLHPQSFCPTCFQVYPPSPTHDSVTTCVKCYSSSHSYCVAAPSSPVNHYICPLCISPNSPIFKLKRATESNVIGGGESLDVSGNSEVYRVIDKTSAKILLAAAKIATASMSKAAVAARAEAERRAKEAAFTRKRAKEALEHVAYLVVREKVRKKEAALLISPEVSGPSGGETVAHLVDGGGGDRNMGHLGGGVLQVLRENYNDAKNSNGARSENAGGGGGGGNVDRLGGGAVQVLRENFTNTKNSDGARIENADDGVRPVVVAKEKADLTGNMSRVDNSSQVLAALNAVELRENENIGGMKALDEVSAKLSKDSCVPMDVDNSEGMMGMKALDEVSAKLSKDSCVPMDVDNSEGMMVSSGSNDGESLVEKKNNVGGSETSANLSATAEDHNLHREKIEEGMVLVPEVEDQMQQEENNEGNHNNGTQQVDNS